MDGYLRNAWYVAAWSQELGEAPLGRRIMDEPIVFFRQSSGKPAAIYDRCPHRFVPLSLGKVEGDVIKCGYHGLRFDADGDCVDDRCNANLKPAAKLRSYPVEELHGAVWVWMGSQQADPALIPEVSFLADPARDQLLDNQTVRANYALELDNLLDLSHLDHVHLSTISSGSVAHGDFKVWSEGDVVHADWFTAGCAIPRQFLPHIPNTDKVDHWMEVTWRAPSYVHIYSGATRCNESRDAGYWINQAHFLTPETKTSTHYFWGIARPDKKDTQADKDLAKARIRQAFVGEDAAMLEAQQRAMKGVDFWSEKPIILVEDGGAVRMRRVLERLVREDAKVETPAPAAEAVAAE